MLRVLLLLSFLLYKCDSLIIFPKILKLLYCFAIIIAIVKFFPGQTFLSLPWPYISVSVTCALLFLPTDNRAAHSSITAIDLPAAERLQPISLLSVGAFDWADNRCVEHQAYTDPATHLLCQLSNTPLRMSVCDPPSWGLEFRSFMYVGLQYQSLSRGNHQHYPCKPCVQDSCKCGCIMYSVILMRVFIFAVNQKLDIRS